VIEESQEERFASAKRYYDIFIIYLEPLAKRFAGNGLSNTNNTIKHIKQ
jgi:hypothetical protein